MIVLDGTPAGQVLGLAGALVFGDGITHCQAHVVDVADHYSAPSDAGR
jgi:hypothetical protein